MYVFIYQSNRCIYIYEEGEIDREREVESVSEQRSERMCTCVRSLTHYEQEETIQNGAKLT